MDSYNRGYNAGVTVEGSQIGTAIVGKASPTGLNSPERAASFFAQSYTLAGGQTVISYRGTDQALPSWQNGTFGDVVNGWTLAAGDIGAAQARLGTFGDSYRFGPSSCNSAPFTSSVTVPDEPSNRRPHLNSPRLRLAGVVG